jgi:hypothetical protein
MPTNASEDLEPKSWLDLDKKPLNDFHVADLKLPHDLLLNIKTNTLNFKINKLQRSN